MSAPREGCVAYSSLCTALHRHFGFSSFKAGQLEALLSALYGKDTYIRMATGGGKSLQAGVRSMCVSQAGDFKTVLSSNCRIGTYAT